MFEIFLKHAFWTLKNMILKLVLTFMKNQEDTVWTIQSKSLILLTKFFDTKIIKFHLSDIKIETFLIVDLFAKEFFKQKMDQKSEFKTSFAQFSRFSESQIKSNPNSPVYRFAKFNKK